MQFVYQLSKGDKKKKKNVIIKIMIRSNSRRKKNRIDQFSSK